MIRLSIDILPVPKGLILTHILQMGYQAILSLWRTLPAVTTFAYSRNQHAEVIRRVRSEQWYREELFARFRPFASTGTWDGINPLAGS